MALGETISFGIVLDVVWVDVRQVAALGKEDGGVCGQGEAPIGVPREVRHDAVFGGIVGVKDEAAHAHVEAVKVCPLMPARRRVRK